MPAGNFMTNMASSVLGMPKKAVLILHGTPPAATPLPGAAPGGMATKLKATANKLGGAMSKVTGNALPTGGPAGSFALQVQYNPASISLQANAEPVAFQFLQQNLDNGIPNQNSRSPSIVLNVDLIFDDMNKKDAFMMDKFLLTPTELAMSAAAAVQSLAGGFSVQPQTNGLLAAVMRKETRTVTFQWADMSFTGVVSEVSAKYTMFSVSGKPVRSVVRLGIYQKVEDRASSQKWNAAFDKAFGGATVANVVGKKTSMGNLINFNL